MRIGPSTAIIASLFLGGSVSALWVTDVSGEPDHTPAVIRQAPITTVATPPPARTHEPTPIIEAPVSEPAVVLALSKEPEPTESVAAPVKKSTPTPKSVPTPTSVVVATTPTEPTPPTTSATDNYTETVITEIHRLTNAARRKAGLPTLAYDAELAATANQKAIDIAARHYFAHTDPDGCDFTCLLKSTHYPALAWGENLMQFTSSKQPSALTLAKQTVENWLKSDGHRENILNEKYTHEGIAVVTDGIAYYAVAHFATPK